MGKEKPEKVTRARKEGRYDDVLEMASHGGKKAAKNREAAEAQFQEVQEVYADRARELGEMTELEKMAHERQDHLLPNDPNGGTSAPA